MIYEYPKIETAFQRDPETFKIPGYGDIILSNPRFAIIKEWEWTEKIDGTNISIAINEEGKAIPSIYGRNEKSEVPKAIEHFIRDRLSIHTLKELFEDKRVNIFGEGYGGKIQAGRYDKVRGGKYRESESFIVFDIVVGSKYWLKREDVDDICTKLNFESVPYIGTFSLPEATERVKEGFTSLLNPGIKAEGLIGRTALPLFDALGRRLICKLKTADFDSKENTTSGFKVKEI